MRIFCTHIFLQIVKLNTAKRFICIKHQHLLQKLRLISKPANVHTVMHNSIDMTSVANFPYSQSGTRVCSITDCSVTCPLIRSVIYVCLLCYLMLTIVHLENRRFLSNSYNK